MNDQYAVLAELAGGFIHEIKNRLSTLGLNLQLLAEDFQDPQTQRERRAAQRVERVQSECTRLLEISNDFLRFARIKELQLAPAELGKVVEELIDFFGPTARAARIEIKTYLPADLPAVLLDKELFKQALLNLLLNAQQAMPEGGDITIQASVEAPRAADEGSPGQEHGCVARAQKGASKQVCLNIIDTGQGMPAEVRAKVFQPFFSAKPGGTGLGLPTTRKIVEAHRGEIDVQSEVGKGTQFTIRLPVDV